MDDRRPYVSVAGEGDGELGAALDVADAETGEALDQQRHVTSLRPTASQFA